MSKILGTYVLESSKNFDDFMKALGVGLVTRKLASATSPKVEFTEKDGTYTINTTSSVKSFQISFKIGEEFTEETSDGRTCKTIFTKEGENKLIQVQKDVKGDKGVDSKFIREFTDTHMNMVGECGDVKCDRIYKRV